MAQASAHIPEYWPPLYESFERTQKGEVPAIKLNLKHPDANLTGDEANPNFVVRTREELEHDIASLRKDINNTFYGDLDPEQDPDITLMTHALSHLNHDR